MFIELTLVKGDEKEGFVLNTNKIMEITKKLDEKGLLL